MKLMLRIGLAISFLVICACSSQSTAELRDGDIIFQTSRSAQSEAIQRATKSKYSHMGIILFREGKPFVFEAIKTVQTTPLAQWVARGEGGHYVVKRLKGADRLLTAKSLSQMEQIGRSFVGKPYDLAFRWSDDRLYCSELVWKIYDRGLGVQIGRLQRLGDFDLSDPVVKDKIEERYGEEGPSAETFITPAEMFADPDLVVVAEG